MLNNQGSSVFSYILCVLFYLSAYTISCIFLYFYVVAYCRIEIESKILVVKSIIIIILKVMKKNTTPMV